MRSNGTCAVRAAACTASSGPSNYSFCTGDGLNGGATQPGDVIKANGAFHTGTESIASILSQSAAATNPSGTVQQPSQPAQTGNGGDSGGGAEASSNAGQARGSLLNILV